MRIKFGRVVGVAAVAAFGVVGFAGTAFAHIEPDPAAAEEGTTVTVGFMVEHGCAGSPTTGLDIKLPDGIADAAAADKPGWTATVDAGVVRFVGQSPSGEEPDTFSITFTAPNTPGEVRFPTVQKCVEGSVDWLDIAEDSQPEHPAPTMTITAGPPTSEQLTPPTDDGSDDAAPATAATMPDIAATVATGVPTAETPATTATPATTVTPVTAVVTAPTVANGDDDSSNTGLVVGIVIAAAVVLGGGGLLAARARARRAGR